MIIGTWQEEEIGSVIDGEYRLTNTEDRLLRVYILRVATFEEWMNYRKEQGRPLNVVDSHIAHYYEVSTD